MSKIYILPIISYRNFMVSGPIFTTTSYWRDYLFSVVWFCLLLCSMEIQNSSSTWGLPQWLSYKEFTYNSGDAGDVSLILGFGRSPEGKMATHCSILAAKKTPWMEEPGGLQFIGSQRVQQDWHPSFVLELHQCLRVFTLYVFSLSC